MLKEAFHAGGWGMWPTLLIGLCAIGASIRYALLPERRLVPVQITLGLLTLLAGALGFVTGLIKATSGLGDLPAEERWIWVLGLGEALNNLSLSLLLLVATVMAACVGAVRAARGAAPEPT